MAVAIGTNLTPCSNLSIFLELFTAPPPSTQTTEETAIEDVVPMRSRAKTTHPWDNAVPLRPEDIIGYSSAVCMKYLYSKKCPFEYIPYLACQLSPVLIKNFDSTKAKRKPGVSEETTYDRFNLQKINELLTDAMTDIAKKWSDNPSLIPAAYLSNYKISIHEDRGMRRTMEDRTFVCLNTDALLGPNHTASYSFSSMEDKNIIDTMEQKTSENENNGNNKSNNDHDENNMETNQSDNNSSTITDNADDNNNNNNNDSNNNNNNNNNNSNSNSNNNNINNNDNNNNNDKDNSSSNSSNTPGILIGVYDGHGGVEAAEFVYSQLYRQILTHPKLDTNTSEAITEAFAHTDEGFLNLSQTEGWKSGSTVLVAYARTPNLMHIAWAGDSQAYLYRRGQYVQIMTPHKPEDEREKERIEQTGGCVVFLGTWRVNGVLSVARAIGDLQQKPSISSVPDINSIEMNGEEDYIVLGCDGLWDIVLPNNLPKIVNDHFKLGKSYDTIAETLVKTAIDQGSMDNVSVVVLVFPSYEPPEYDPDFKSTKMTLSEYLDCL